jgi:multiple sugar transport system substrate-binding protein
MKAIPYVGSGLHAAVRWGRRHGFAVGLLSGAVAGVVVTLLATALVVPAGSGLPPGELVILSGRDQSDGGQRQVLVDQWNALHPANKATIVELPEIADAAHSEMVARAQSGRDDVDIYNLDVTWIAEFADAGYIRPLDESGLDTDGFLTNPLDTCRYNGRLWALPFNTDAGLLYYRKDLVAHPPGSWAQLRRDVEDVLAGTADQAGAGAATVPAGYAGQLADYEGLTVNALEAMQSAAGGNKVVDDGEVTVDLADMQEGVNRLRPTPGEPQIVLPQSLEQHEEQTTQAFRDGKVLFMRNWPVAYRSLAGTAAGEPSAPHVPFDVTPLPGPSVLGGQNLAVARSSVKPAAAQALIEFLTSDRSEQILFQRGGLAATREVVYLDAEIRQRYPYAGVLLQAVQRAHPRPVTPCYSRFSEVFRAAVNKALRDGEPLPSDFKETLESVLDGC